MALDADRVERYAVEHGADAESMLEAADPRPSREDLAYVRFLAGKLALSGIPTIGLGWRQEFLTHHLREGVPDKVKRRSFVGSLAGLFGIGLTATAVKAATTPDDPADRVGQIYQKHQVITQAEASEHLAAHPPGRGYRVVAHYADGRRLESLLVHKAQSVAMTYAEQWAGNNRHFPADYPHRVVRVEIRRVEWVTIGFVEAEGGHGA